MKRFFKKRMNKKGFTLIELIVAIGIMLILAAVAVPFLLAHIKNAKVGNINEQLLNVKAAFDSYYVAKGGLGLDDNTDGNILDDMVLGGWINEVQSKNGLTWKVVELTDSQNRIAHVVQVEASQQGLSFFNDVIKDLDTVVDGQDSATSGMLRYCSGQSKGVFNYVIRKDASFTDTVLNPTC